MKVIRIYCENGALTSKVKKLKEIKDIKLLYFPFENYTKKANRSNSPSLLTCDNTFVTADDDRIIISDTLPSEAFIKIENIVGRKNFNDIRHIDTAYKEKCQIFISPDKGDIINKSDKLEKITGMKFFYCDDFDSINNEIEKLKHEE